MRKDLAAIYSFPDEGAVRESTNGTAIVSQHWDTGNVTYSINSKTVFESKRISFQLIV